MNADAGNDIHNPLATALTATIRELVAARQETLAVKIVSAAQRDYTAWLQAELCKARDWTTVDVIKLWHDELDRRAHNRSMVHGARWAA